MSRRANRPGNEPRLFQTLKSDVGHVPDDLRRHGLRREVGGTLSDLETFHLSEDVRKCRPR